MKCDDCPASWAERDIMTACGVEHGEYGCYIQGKEYGGEGDSCDLANFEVELRLKELKMYARGKMKRPEWLLQRFLHDLTSQMSNVECSLPGFPPLWQSKTDLQEDEYCITVKPLYGFTDMHYEIRGACRDVLEKVSEVIAFTKRNIKSENSDYLTGYISALSGVEGVIAEVRDNEGLKAADTIEALSEKARDGWISVDKQLPEAEKNEWISVNDRMPEKEGNYLVWYEDDDVPNNMDVHFYDEGCECFGYWYEVFDPRTYGKEGEEFCEIEVTHWMPLPQPPEGIGE